jgi:hypothetical protein
MLPLVPTLDNTKELKQMLLDTNETKEKNPDASLGRKW